jgi:predicted alpha/beta-fold hydrolase
MLKFLILLIPAPLFYFFPLELLLISLTTLISLTLYPQFNRKTTLIHHESSSLTKTLSNCKSLKTYNPSIFLFNGFLQGLFGITLGSKPGSSSLCEPVTYEREHLRLPDGGEISIDWLKTSKPSAILVVAAGLGADSSSQSTRSVALEAKMKGLTVAVIHGRGISCELKVTFK